MIDVARVAVIGADLVSLRALSGAAPSFYHRNQWSVIWLLTRLSSFPHVRVCVCLCVCMPVLRTYTVVVYLPLDCCIAAVNRDV